MNLLWMIKRAVRRLKFDMYFGIEKGKKNKKLVKVSIKSIKHPIFLRNNSSDIGVFYQIFDSSEYDIKFNFEPKVFIDCGANIGLASIYFKNRFPNVTIIAVEPEPSNFELLVKNTAAYEGIHCLQSGIWNKTTNLKIRDLGLGNWGFVTEEVEYEDATTIKAISIDGLMEKFGINNVDILKIDIETSEKELFEKNYESWIPNVKLILVELHDRMKPGCSKSFFKAMVNYDFSMRMKGEYVICQLK